MEQTRSVSSIVGEDYKMWNKGTPIIISTPTGSGKTTFVLERLLPFAAKNGHSMCYMSNRNILKHQVENRIDQSYLGAISVMNYQSSIREIRESVWLSYYWVFDEAHFFLSDSSFNKSIGELIDFVKLEYKKHICVFMTATPQYLFFMLRYIFDDILRSPLPRFPEPFYLTTGENSGARKEEFKSVKQLLVYKELPPASMKNYTYQDEFGEQKIDFERLRYDNRNRFSEIEKKYFVAFKAIKDLCKVYNIPQDYSYIVPCYFRDNTDLVDMVQHTSEAEKWIIFVPNKKLGHEIKDNFLKSGICNVAYLDALGGDQNGKKAKKSIIATNTFPYRILICTKVLDNGINIDDPAVRHIAIIKTDETTFLQMLGRKRVNQMPHETVNLYIRDEKSGNIQKFFNQKYLNILLFMYSFLLTKQAHYAPYKMYGEPYVYSPTSGIVGTSYAEGGQFKYPYKNFVEQECDIQEALNRLSKNSTHASDNIDRLLVETYKIRVIAKQQIIYEYYKMLAMFEAYENEVSESSDPIEDTMWLKAQLKWIGHVYNPLRWNTVVFGMEQTARDQLESFLYTHQGILLKENEERLKKLVLKYLSTLRPEPKESKSQASFIIVQRVLNRYKFPYILSKKRSSKNGKDRFWWEITFLNINEK